MLASLLLLVAFFISAVSYAQRRPLVTNPPLANGGFSSVFNGTSQPGNTRAPLSGSTLLNEFNYPVNECFTYTYLLQISNSASDVSVNNTFTAANGITYLVGSVGDGTDRNGLLQQIGYEGNVTQSRAFGTAGRMEAFNNIEQLSTGNLLLVGTSSAPDGSDKKILIAEVNAQGSLVWAKSINNEEGFEGIAISPTIGNGIGFAGHNDSTMVFGKLDYAGNLQWLKRIRLLEKGAIVGMGRYNWDSWYIGYTGMDAERHASVIMRIASTDGSIIWANRLGGADADADFIVHDLQVHNIRPKLTGVFAPGNEPYRLFKASVNITGELEFVQTFEMAGVNFDTTAQSRMTPWAEVIAFKPKATDEQLYVFRNANEGYPDSLVYWQQRFATPSGLRLSAVERTFDGGYLIAANNVGASATSGYLLKTDSIGVIKDCSGTEFTFTDKAEYDAVFSTINTTVKSIASAASTLNLNAADIILTTAFSCRSLTCPVLPPEDECIVTFARKYRSAAGSEIATALLTDRVDEIIVAGVTRTNPYDPGTEAAFLAKLDARGKVINRKSINLGRGTSISHIYRTADGNMLMLGGSVYTHPDALYDTSYITISKFTSTFDLIWNSAFPIYGPYSAVYGLVESEDGSIFLQYVEGRNFCEDLSIIKLDRQGKLVWANNYLAGIACTMGYVGSITQDATHLYTASFITGGLNTLLMKVNKATGAVEWSRGFAFDGANQATVANSLSFIGDNLVLNGLVTFSTTSRDVVAILDKNGNIKRSRYFTDNEGTGLGLQMRVTNNQELVFTGSYYDKSYFLRLDSNLNTLYSKKLPIGNNNVRAMSVAPDGSVYDAGLFFSDNNPYLSDMALKKYSFDGLIGNCAVDTMAYTSSVQHIEESSVSVSVSPAPVVLTSLPFQTATFSLQQNSLVCSGVSLCKDLKLEGPAAICDTQTHVFKVRRNLNCTTPVMFTYDQDNLKVLSRTDSTISVQFIRSGTTIIKAGIFTGCRWIEDYLEVKSSILQNQSFSLGNDTTLCTGNTLTLQAPSGYATYKWQDGSTESWFKVKEPGVYSIQVADACGNKFSDEVKVTAAPPFAFDAGPDRVKCNGDTLQLNAPAGFISYQWANDYRISSTTSASVVVDPLVDTAYYVRAEKSPGCFAYDTIRVRVFNSPAISLGNDTAFCKGSTLTLDAGDGFMAYVWNTGATGRQITIAEKGIYSVIGTTIDGCRSYDTLQVINVHTNPIVSLGDNNAICEGTIRQLGAGNFAHYLWNDGSTERTITVDKPGNYSVRVTDHNGCSTTGSLLIDKILPLPGNFLPKDTAICTYGTLVLKPLDTFSEYTWSDGSKASILTINRSGIYRLEVKDAAGCTGTDEIVVRPKECLEGLYVPNAFTPNNDGQNDLFRAMLMGPVKAFQLTVYNRWGEVVFQTSDPQKGWDGRFKGKAQDANVFVWVCRYQLEGREATMEKGTVMIIR